MPIPTLPLLSSTIRTVLLVLNRMEVLFVVPIKSVPAVYGLPVRDHVEVVTSLYFANRNHAPPL